MNRPTILGPFDQCTNRFKSGLVCGFEFTKSYDLGTTASKQSMHKHTNGRMDLYGRPYSWLPDSGLISSVSPGSSEFGPTILDLPGISANAGENGPRPVRRPTNPGMLAPKNGRATILRSGPSGSGSGSLRYAKGEYHVCQRHLYLGWLRNSCERSREATQSNAPGVALPFR